MGEAPVRIVGSYLSPYVRKVLVALDLKGVHYEIDPIVPFFGSEAFSRCSPLRRVPVLVDDRVTLADSTVIGEYLEERHPDPPLFPKRPEERARARWLEEFADTRMGEVIIWKLFDQRVIRPHVWREPTDAQIVRRALEDDLPQVLGYLEEEVPAEGFLFDAMALADIALGAFFRNAAFAGFEIEGARWPRTAAFVTRVLDHPSFRKLRPFEELALRTPIAQQREALRAAGAPISGETLGTSEPRRGVRAP